MVADERAVADRVMVAMTDEEVREIVEKYFTRFRDLRLDIARLRSRWMAERTLR